MTNLSVILGAVIVAAIFGALFFGAASVQTYNYYHTYRTDHVVLKGAVGVLWSTNALHFAIYTYTVWYYVVDALDTAWVPQIMNWSFKLSVWLAVALVLLLDIFYTFWIYKLSPTPVLPAIVALAVAAGSIVAVVLGVRIIIFTHFTNIYAISASALIYLFFILFCVKATAIAGGMGWCLFFADTETDIGKQDEGCVRRAVRMVVGSSGFVAACSFAVLACHLAMPHSMSCVVVYMIVSKAYHNCFLSLLASRPTASASTIPAHSEGLEGKMDGHAKRASGSTAMGEDVGGSL
ncbi:hypothetical protein MSAN_01688900 [Mycena sanguinolenta]|uniref:Uncharacterized protein n=1 Tax=Mycena sanguinolenta TaxID=230812 RepID=A0A8H6XXX8_9AGAR|nr:hypothetical protein MSAN_01688900 [Mycena sanguinolenta]